MRKIAEDQVETPKFLKSPIVQRLIGLFVVSFLILACSLFDISPLVNGTAPDFTLKTLGGREVQLSQFEGKPVMINFWATWCGPCRVELPLIQDRFEKHYPSLVVLAVEDGSTPSEISETAYASGITFLILMGYDGVLSAYNVRAFPTTFFVDVDGVIRSQHVGQLSPNQLDAELNKLGLE